MTFAWVRRMGGSLLEWLSSRRAQALALTLLLVVGIFVIGNSVLAAPTLEDVKKWIFGVFGELLAYIIDLLGKLIILLVNQVINFATYNNFVNAEPVVIGWVLVRDVVNMFFIVVLLVSAFSTIIGYSEFHYSKVLPKLLLMAVLINFSKTFIGLMIDFSQVLMLTFVNAFKAAAAGNFYSMLHLNQITQLNTELTDQNLAVDIESLEKLIVASLLGVIMLGIVVSILIIMIAFLIYRIIALWMLLIISPMAFFCLALPGKLAKGLSAFTGAFWERLSNLLIAGPVMAFFLWLALAIAQGGQGFNSIYTAKESTEISEASQFVNKAASPPNLASFVVAVAFLLAGVEFAVKTANSLSPSLAKVANAATNPLSTTYRAGQRALSAAQRTARTTGKVVGGVARGADYVTGNRLSSAVGRAGLQIAPSSSTLANLAGTRSRNIRAKTGALEKSLSDLSPATRDSALRKLADGFGQKATGAQILLARSAGTTPGLKNRQSLIEADIKAQNPNLNQEELAALVESRALDQAGADLTKGKKTAESVGDDANLGKFKEALEKNPSLNQDWKDFASIKGASVDDKQEYLKKISAESVKDSRTALAHMKALGLVSEDGAFLRNDENKETWDRLLSGDRGKIIQSHVDAYQGRGGEGAAAIQAQFRAMDGNADAVDAANRGRHYATVKSGYVGSVFVAPQGAGNAGQATRPTIQQNVNIRNEAQITEGAARLTELAQNNVAANAPQAQDAQRSMLAAGATLSEAFNLNQNAEFASRENRDAFEGVMRTVSQELAQEDEGAIQIIRNLDTAALSQRDDQYNEARSAAVASFSADALRTAFEHARTQNDQQLQNKVTELLDVIDKEAQRVRSITSRAGGRPALVEVAAGANTPRANEAIQRMIDAGADRQERAVEAARAAILSNQIDASDAFRAIRGEVGSRAERSANRARAEREGALRRRREPPPENA